MDTRPVAEAPNRAISGLGEGDTPLSSFKDRGITVALSRAIADGNKTCICASPPTPPPPLRGLYGPGGGPLRGRLQATWVEVMREL